MYLFECEATLEAEPDAVWKVWTDVAHWPEWDVSKEIARLEAAKFIRVFNVKRHGHGRHVTGNIAVLDGDLLFGGIHFDDDAARDRAGILAEKTP